MTSALPAHLANEKLDDLVLYDLFELAAQAFPNLTALAWEGGALTYSQLRGAASAQAAQLAGASKVAIFNDRSPNLAIAVLSTLRAGAAYVPLDRTYPDGRLTYMVENSGAEIVVCQAELAGRLSLPAGCRLHVVGEGAPAADGLGAIETARRPVAPHDLAYVSYTSGSTGRPKGVAMPHRALTNLAVWQVGWSAAEPGWRTLHLQPLSVDISFQEMFTTWSNGGTVVLVGDSVRSNPDALLRYLEDQRINRFFAPFVMLQELVSKACQANFFPTALREVITLGEQLQVGADIRRFFTMTGATLENQYGATETHVVTAERLSPDPETWPALPSIGRAITNTRVEILGSDLQPLSAGVEGEIGISGVCVADGYLGMSDLTAELFRETGDERDRIYMTGDYGIELADGRLQYRGRRDTQVKIKGFRVELGEVENCLRSMPNVADAVVTSHHTSSAGCVLVAHCVPAGG